MKQPHRSLFAAGLLAAALGAGAFAQAQTQTAPADGAGHQMRGDHGARDPAKMAEFRARREQRMAERLGQLKQKLAIAPAQEGAWNNWAAAMKPTPHGQQERGEWAQLTTPERIDRMRALRAERGAEMDKRMDATKNFYSALNPEQRKTFDAESLRFLGGKHHHGGHRG
ncbi:MAG TPA: Spy/CpxP family protein refolding chaperone [Acetobacteraceae bacterium]